jgi:hypothetical protein
VPTAFGNNTKKVVVNEISTWFMNWILFAITEDVALHRSLLHFKGQ